MAMGSASTRTEPRPRHQRITRHDTVPIVPIAPIAPIMVATSTTFSSMVVCALVIVGGAASARRGEVRWGRRRPGRQRRGVRQPLPQRVGTRTSGPAGGLCLAAGGRGRGDMEGRDAASVAWVPGGTRRAHRHRPPDLRTPPGTAAAEAGRSGGRGEKASKPRPRGSLRTRSRPVSRRAGQQPTSRFIELRRLGATRARCPSRWLPQGHVSRCSTRRLRLAFSVASPFWIS